MSDDTIEKEHAVKNKIYDAMFGLAVGDAIGVPVEFTQPHIMKEHPLTDMVGGGSHGMPAGTWSDDTTLALTLMKGLTESSETPDYDKIMEYSLAWLDRAEFTATDKVFDVGKTCLKSIMNYARGCSPLECGQSGEHDCGNGGLMRCIPAVFWLRKHYGQDFIKDSSARDIIHNISSLTHGYERCLVANGLYLSVAAELLKGKDKANAVKDGLKAAADEYVKESKFAEQLPFYKRIFEESFKDTPDDDIKSSGYVVDTLEAAIWSFLGTDNYRDCILKAVNLGHDTDTIAAVAGGLAGIYYGYEAIPEKWREGLIRSEYIRKLCDRFAESLQ